MSQQIILAGVPPVLVSQYAAYETHTVNTMEGLWDVLSPCIVDDAVALETLVIVGKIDPSPKQYVISIGEVVHHLRCISHDLSIIFYGDAAPWVVKFLLDYEINAYVSARHPQELTIAIDHVLKGKGQYISPAIDLQKVKIKPSNLSWRKLYSLITLCNGFPASNCARGIGEDDRHNIYKSIKYMSKQFGVPSREVLVAKMVGDGFLLA